MGPSEVDERLKSPSASFPGADDVALDFLPSADDVALDVGGSP